MGKFLYKFHFSIKNIFKKMYCKECGSRLKKSLAEDVFYDPEEYYENYDIYMTAIHGYALKRFEGIKAISYNYECPVCGKETTCLE